MSTESGMVLVPRAEIEKIIYDVDASGFMVRSKLKQFIAAAPASPPTPAVDGWQPIETLPKNEVVLLWCGDYMTMGLFNTHVKKPRIVDCCDHPDFGFDSATHWIPLPEPPK